MIRTWAVWNRVRTLGFVLLALFLAAAIVVIFTVTKYLKAFASLFFFYFMLSAANRFLVAPTPFPTFDGCYVILNYTEMPVPILAWLVIDTGIVFFGSTSLQDSLYIVVLFTLMVISAYRTCLYHIISACVR
jgi:hypothetical protein